MFKKTLILASVMALTMTATFAADTAMKTIPAQKIQAAQGPEYKSRTCECHKGKEQFENRLKLTDAQKEQAKQIRMKGHEEIKPVVEKIKALKAEKEVVKLSRIAVKFQEEKIAAIDSQIKDLRKQAHELRVKNMKEFESILTAKQQKELKKMKEEGRKKFEKKQKKHNGERPMPCKKMGPPTERPED